MLDMVGQLQAERESFSRSERRLVDIVLADVDAAASGSIVELAARAEISPPTITRFCRRLGCQSFSEFKVRLAKSRMVGERYLMPPTGPQTALDIARHIVNAAQSTLYSFFESLDPEALERAGERIAGSSYLLCYGSGGASSMVATEFETRLFRLGLRVTSSLDHQAQLMRAAAAPKGTVIIASSVSGRNVELARTLAIAGEYGMERIVLTRPRSAVAEQADVLHRHARGGGHPPPLRRPLCLSRHDRRRRPDRRHPHAGPRRRRHAQDQAPACHQPRRRRLPAAGGLMVQSIRSCRSPLTRPPLRSATLSPTGRGTRVPNSSH